MKFRAAILTAAWLAGCASTPRMEYAREADPTEELMRMQARIESAERAQIDVVAARDLERAQSQFASAREEYEDPNGSPAEFWNRLGAARGSIERAEMLYREREPKASAVLEARAAALKRDVRHYRDTAHELKRIDDQMRKESAQLDPEDLEQLRVRYHELEIKGLQASKIGEARRLVANAVEFGAQRRAPQTLAEARSAIGRAERAIATYPMNETAYMPEVENANRVARLLIAVNAQAREVAAASDEQTARQILMRDLAISSLESELIGAELERDLVMTASRQMLSEQRWKEALAEAQSRFEPSEAEVFRKGDQLLIRLKQKQFPKPALIEKVSGVINDLDATLVEVQGRDAKGVARELRIDEHTDIRAVNYERPVELIITP